MKITVYKLLKFWIRIPGGFVGLYTLKEYILFFFQTIKIWPSGSLEINEVYTDGYYVRYLYPLLPNEAIYFRTFGINGQF